MSSFDQLSSSFKISTQQRLHNIENEFHQLTPTESNINSLEAMLKHKVESAKEDLNNRIDEIQNAVTIRRPDRNDPDYARKQAQYGKLLREANEARSSRQRSAHQVHGNTGQSQHAMNQSSYANSTTTIIEEQIRKKLPTLVLKLKQRALSYQSNGKTRGHQNHQKLSDLSDRELDEYLRSNLKDFKYELMNSIDNFHQMILSAKPNPAKKREDPEGYQIHMESYQDFLKLANELVKHMQESFNDIFTRYQEHIDKLWEAICQGGDIRHVQRQFEQQMQQNMAYYWKPIFDRADQLIAEIDLNFNQYSARPMPAIKSPR